MTAAGSTSSVAVTTSRSSGVDYADFDTKALVEAKLQSRTAQISRLNDEVKVNNAKISAYKDLQNKIAMLGRSATALRSAPDSGGRRSDVFRAREASLTASSGARAETYLSASVRHDTALNGHSITISKVAKANILSSAVRSSQNDALGWSGSFTIGAGTTPNVTVIVSADMSLAEVTEAINAETGVTKVEASVMKVADNQYRLILTATETGKVIRLADTAGSSLLADASKFGLIDNSGDVKAENVLQAAQNAEFTVDGVSLVRSDNDVSDVLEGVTLRIYNPTPDGEVLTLKVNHDLNTIKTALTSFVESYNALRDIVISGQATKPDGSADGNATLFGDANLRAVAAIQNILSSSVDGRGLGEIGIKFDADNKLTIHDGLLNKALLNDLDAVETLFSYRAVISSGDLTLLRHPNSSFTFELNVTVDASGKLIGADVGGDTSVFDVSGSAITGKAGTAYEGLTLLYTGKVSKTISVKLSQGMADRMHYVADKFANADSGVLSGLISSLGKANSNVDSRIQALEASTQSYAKYLSALYGRMANRIAQAQTTIKLFKAFLKSGLD